MRSVWNVGDWGDACGPRPHGGGAGSGTATIAQQGSELTIQGPTRAYSTTQCWEQFPGMRTVSHSGGRRGWRTVCRTPAGDPRQATVTTNITATDTHINFDEVGQYQFVVSKQNCTASVRRSRTFKLIQREGELSEAEKRAQTKQKEAEEQAKREASEREAAEREAAEREASARKETKRGETTHNKPTKTPDTCASPGAPARLEVRPSAKLIRVGESFTFRTTVLDAQGCVLEIEPMWKVVGGSSVQLTGGGEVSVPDGTAEGVTQLTASVGGKSATVRLQIVSNERYEELLRTEAFDAQGESKGAAVAVIASGGLGAGKAVTDEKDRQRKVILLVVLGVVAVALGITGVVLAQRAKRPPPSDPHTVRTDLLSVPAIDDGRVVCPTCGQDYPSTRSYCPNDGNRLVRAVEDGEDSQGGVCPVCGVGYNPGTEHCPEHGEELIPVAVYQASRDGRARPTHKICPVCGTQYPGDAEFCGLDGAQLVPVN